MSIVNNIVDQFNTMKDEISMPSVKVQSNNVWVDPVVDDCREKLQILVQFMKDSCLAHALSTSFASDEVVVTYYFYYYV